MAEAAGELGLSERHLWRLRATFERRRPGRPGPRQPGPLITSSRRARGPGPHRRAAADPLRRAQRQPLHRAARGAGGHRREPRDGAGHPACRGHRQPAPAPAAEAPQPPAADGGRGQLLQLDGSPHDWLEDRGPWLSLLGAIDDATGRVPAAVFRSRRMPRATSWCSAPSSPRRASPRPSTATATAPSSRPGRRRAEDGAPDEETLSQVGRALVELGIGSIAARSPQAKGRIERLWGTFQDRLVAELRLAGIADLAGANAFLPAFLARYNARFAVPAADPVPAWRPVPPGLRLERVLVFKYLRKVAKDHTIRLDGRVLQLPRWGAGAELRRQAGRGPRPARRLDRRLRRRARAGRPAGTGGARPAARPARPAGGPGLDPAAATMPWIPPVDHPWKRITPDRRRYQRLTESLGS